MPSPLQPPKIPDAERIVLIARSLIARSLIARSLVARPAETIQQLRDEIAVLKEEKPPVALGFGPSIDEAFARS